MRNRRIFLSTPIPGKQHPVDPASVIQAGKLLGLHPVSYTHLDVYKRQVYPKAEGTKKTLFTAMTTAGVLLLAFLVIYKDMNGKPFQISWWGILGLIGWTFAVCAGIYLFTRESLRKNEMCIRDRPKTTSTKINVNTASAMNACNIIPSANPLEPVAVGPP